MALPCARARRSTRQGPSHVAMLVQAGMHLAKAPKTHEPAGYAGSLEWGGLCQRRAHVPWLHACLDSAMPKINMTLAA